MVAMYEVKSMKKTTKNKPKEKYSGQQRREVNSDEPHLMPNEKMQPIQWTERQLVHWWLLLHSGHEGPISEGFVRGMNIDPRNIFQNVHPSVGLEVLEMLKNLTIKFETKKKWNIEKRT